MISSSNTVRVSGAFFRHIAVLLFVVSFIFVLDSHDSRAKNLAERFAITQKKGEAALRLTDAEKAFLRKGVVLRISEVDWEPLSIIGRDGHFRGIIADYLEMISFLTGLKFEFSNSNSWAEVLQKYNQHELDVIPALSIGEMVGRDILFSETYVSFPLVIVTADSQNSVHDLSQFKNKRVAAGQAYTSYHYIEENYPVIDLVGSVDVEEGLLLLTKGKVDAFVGHLAVVVDNMNRLGLKNLKIAGTTKYKFEHRIGVSPDYPQVVSIINKALALIDDETHREIRHKWFDVRYEQTTDYRDILFVFAFLTLALAMIIFWNRKLFRLNDSLNKEVAMRRRMEKVHNILYEIALSVSRVSGIDEFYSIVQGQVNKLMYARNFYIAAYDRDTDMISFPYFSDEKEVAPASRKMGVGLTDYVIRTGEPLFGDRATRLELRDKGKYELIGQGCEIWLGVPLKLWGDVVGVIVVQSYDPKQVLDEKDLEVLLFLSSYVGLALERLSLVEKGREQTLALKEREIKYRAIFDNASDAILLMDFEFHFISANPEAVSMFRYSSEEELLATSPDHLISSDQPDGVSVERLLSSWIQTTLEEGGMDFDIVCRRKDGEDFFASVRTRMMEIAGIPLLQATLSDVTENRRTKKELEDTNQRLNDIVDFLPDPTIVIDSNGIIQAWNNAVEEVTGVSKEDMLGKGDYEYAIPFYGERRPILIDFAMRVDLDPLTDRYESLERRGNMLYGEVYTPRVFDGEGAYLWGVAGPLRNHSGEVVGAVECMRNVTERRQVELELKRAKLAAEAATRAKSEFLANMSHEIRTPMNSILGFGHLMQNTDLEPAQRETLDKIMSSADSLLSIIGDILDFSKIEAGKFILENVKFKLDRVLEKICNMVTVKAEFKGIDFVLSVAPDVPFSLYGDPLRLEQVLTNLVNNAVKFTETGGVSLIVSCENCCGEDSQIKFMVRDSGIGLSAAEISQLFNSFTQADASTTRKYGGTGLGLAIARSLVELMGGTVNVESQPGVGSSFYFTVPMKSAEDDSMQYLPDTKDCAGILVVESNRVARDFVRFTLEQAGFMVSVNSSASGVIQRITDPNGMDGVDFILISAKLHDLPVLDVVSRIKSTAGLENIPVILMVSVAVDDVFRSEAAFTGVDGFVSRPLTRLSLYNALSNEFSEPEMPVALEEFEKVDADSDLDFKGKPPRILVVEDNELNQQVAIRVLEDMGMEVEVAGNGRRALDALATDVYNLVLMDIQMPEMDGLTAAKIIRSDRRYKNLPILAMTAHAMPDDRRKSFEAGMNGHLVKPINTQELKRALAKYLGTELVVYTPEQDNLEANDSLPMDLPGINIARGVLNVGGNREGYLKVLLGFREGYTEFSAELDKALSLSGPEQALVKVHSLKGIAGSIGATRLYELCRSLEGTLRGEDGTDYTGELEALSVELDMILKGLNGMVPVQDQHSREYVFNKEKSFNLIGKLYMMLGEGDAESGDVLDELRVHFNLEKYEKQLDELTRHIDNFDFDDGRSVLEMIAEQLGITLENRQEKWKKEQRS